MSAGDHTTIKVPDQDLRAASALTGPLAEHKPGLRAGSPGARITRAAAYRFFAYRGMEAFREEMRGEALTVAGVGDGD